jgi:PIN domain nuclease of toxin-antitoxin system
MAGGRVILLDTCALLWLAEGGQQLSAEVRDRIEAPAVVYVSAISAFEIALKVNSGKLKLPVPPADWFRAILDHHGLAVCALDWEICIAATTLPPIHRDPCDRFIIATAKAYRLPVVTHDRNFAAYGLEIIS